MRRRPEDLGLHPDGARQPDDAGGPSSLVIEGASLRQALDDRGFWWLTAAFFLETFSTVAAGVYLIPFLIAGGYDPRFAAVATGLIGAMQVASRVVVTTAGSRWAQISLTATVFALQGIALVILLGWRGPIGVLTAVVFLGAGRGVVTIMRASLVAERYGRANYGAIGGTLALFVSGAAALAPVGTGVGLGVAGSYVPVFLGLTTASLLAALALFGVRGSPHYPDNPATVHRAGSNSR